MSKVMYLDTQNLHEDINAATSITFEVAKGSSDKIVWFSNLNKIVEHINFEIKRGAFTIASLDKKVVILEETIKSMTECVFALKDSIDKLEKRQKDNFYKTVEMINALAALKGADGDQVDD